jgi:hypothetical protein
MTDRYYALTVVLDREIREDDARLVMEAIAMIKGVAKVVPEVADPALYAALDRARREIREKIWKLLE